MPVVEDEQQAVLAVKLGVTIRESALQHNSITTQQREKPWATCCREQDILPQQPNSSRQAVTVHKLAGAWPLTRGFPSQIIRVMIPNRLGTTYG